MLIGCCTFVLLLCTFPIRFVMISPLLERIESLYFSIDKSQTDNDICWVRLGPFALLVTWCWLQLRLKQCPLFIKVGDKVPSLGEYDIFNTLWTWNSWPQAINKPTRLKMLFSLLHLLTWHIDYIIEYWEEKYDIEIQATFWCKEKQC